MKWLLISETDEWKDGRHVLVADNMAVSEARYHADKDGWWLANTDPTDYHDGRIYPTHWQPMPAPPSLSAA